MNFEPLWTAKDIAAAIHGKFGLESPQARPDWLPLGVSIDSRTLAPQDLFVAIAGETSDGHAHVKAALAAGAAGALVSRRPDGIAPNDPDNHRLIFVANTRKALDALGRKARARTEARIVAVTGSVGKTGSKEALKAALGRYRPTHASAASYNNDIGVPLSLARMPASAGFGVFELGMNHEGELTPLSLMVRPHVALITTVEAAHMAHFSSIEAIADAKAEVFAGLQPGGTAVLNLDNGQYSRLAAAAEDYGVGQVITFGHHESADVRPMQVALHETCSCITADIAGQIMTYKIGLPGRHWVLNSLGILATVKAIGGDLGLAGLALAELSAVEGRGRRHEIALADPQGAKITLIDESYNANPASMRAAIETLGQINIEPVIQSSNRPDIRHPDIRHQGRRIAVLGDMAELGPDAPRLHAELASAIEAAKIDLVFTVGHHMAELHAALPPELKGKHMEAAEKMAGYLRPRLKNGDVVMVKGSKSTGMGQIVKAILAQGLVNQNKQAIG